MSEKRRIGVMGGTFDPIHYGHLVCAEEARWQFDLEEVVFAPTGQPWQKREVSQAEDRYMLTMLATAPNEKFSVSRVEIDRRGPTYTRDTLKEFKEFYGNEVDLFFITGADAVLDILSWKDPDEVLDLAHIIAATRPEYDLTRLDQVKVAGRVKTMQIPALAISSTDIRERVRSGRPIRYLVPRDVIRYIEERGLYREGSGDSR